MADEYQRTVHAASPLAGTYRLRFAFPEGDTLTLYARTLRGPLAPVFVEHGAGEGAIVGHAVRIYAATSPDSLPHATRDVVFDGATPRSGGTVIALLPTGAPTDPGGFGGAWAVRLPRGANEGFDRRRDLFDARLRELHPFYDEGKEMSSAAAWEEEDGVPPEPPATAWFAVDSAGTFRSAEVYVDPDGAVGYELEAERVSAVTVELDGRGAGASADDDILVLGAPPGVPKPNFRGAGRFGLLAVASPPELLTGLSIVGVPRRGFGLYLDAEWNPLAAWAVEPLDTASAVTAERVRGDSRVDETREWVLLNVGVTRGLIGHVALYAGAGVGWRTRYLEYQETGSTALGGTYWIRDGRRLGASATGGVLVLLGRDFLAQVGYHARPRAFTVGFGYSLPYYSMPAF